MSLLRLWHPTGPRAPGVEVWASSAAIDEAARRLPAGGVAWVVVGRAQRARAERALRRAGLAVAERVLMVPGWPATSHLVPLAPGPLRDAGVRHLGLSPRQARVLARLAAWRPTRLLLSRAVPGCGLVAVHPARARPLEWLGAIDGAGVATATLSQSARADARAAVALRFAPGAAVPDLAVKLALDAAGSARVEAERRALLELGPAARAAGAAVPAPMPAPRATAEDPAGGRPLVTGALTGSPASALLRRRPDRLTAVLLALSDWLLAWNRATAATSSTAGDALVERRLLGPAARIAEAIPSAAPYAAAMRALAARLDGEPLVTVAVHDDMTMSNVLVGSGGLGIVDWEAARCADLPLLDLWYALADGLARARRIDHLGAVEILRGDARDIAPAIDGLPAEHAEALGLSPDQAQLGFHACWLGHADDELRRGAPGPFVAIVEALAQRGPGR